MLHSTDELIPGVISLRKGHVNHHANIFCSSLGELVIHLEQIVEKQEERGKPPSFKCGLSFGKCARLDHPRGGGSVRNEQPLCVTYRSPRCQAPGKDLIVIYTTVLWTDSVTESAIDQPQVKSNEMDQITSLSPLFGELRVVEKK